MPSARFRHLVHNAAPPSLHRVREGPFPCFNATMGRCDSLPFISPRFVSSLGDTIVRPLFVPTSSGSRCLRFAVAVTRPHARLASRLLARLYRTRLVTRRISMKGFTF